jgi:hypothetical protein
MAIHENTLVLDVAPPRAKKRLFPMHLTPFENYMLMDDRRQYPMTFIVTFEFSGNLVRDDFAAAIDEALDRHPLLQAIIQPAKQNRDCWVDAKGLKPKLDWGDLDDPVEFVDSEFIDLRREIGLRIWIRHDEKRAVVTTQFHHSVCDGIGSYQFLGDVLWFYARRTGDNELDELPPFDERILRKRGRASFAAANFLDDNGKFKKEWAESARLLFLPITALKRTRKPLSQRKAAIYPGIKSFIFDKAEHRDIRLHAQELGQTQNDYLLEKLFVAMQRWDREQRIVPLPQTFSVMLPMDLREPGMQFPAANIVTYCFIRRRGRRLNNRDLLVRSLREEMTELKNTRHHTKFMNMIFGAHFYPRTLRTILSGHRCLATAILSNTGDPTKRFYVSLPREKGVLRAGNLTLEEISGVPPIRPNTRASISIFTYRRRLKISVRCDPNHFDEADTQKLVETYVSAIRDGMNA